MVEPSVRDPCGIEMNDKFFPDPGVAVPPVDE
jgi:hypothetical protein